MNVLQCNYKPSHSHISVLQNQTRKEDNMENETTQLLTKLLEGFSRLETRLDTIDEKLDTMEGRLGKIEKRLDTLENRTTSIEVQLENIVVPRIQLIAESHIDLSRKLDNAIEQRLEREILKMRVEVLEGDMRRYKLQ